MQHFFSNWGPNFNQISDGNQFVIISREKYSSQYSGSLKPLVKLCIKASGALHSVQSATLEQASNLEIFNFELTAHPNAKDVESLQFLVFKYIFLKSQSIVCLLAHDGSAGFSLGFKISDDIDVYFQLLHLL